MKKLPVTIKGYENLYEIYEDGSMFSLRKQRMMKPLIKGLKGYVAYFLTGHNKKHRKWFYEHRLSAHHFIEPCPKGLEVNHKDENKQNNHYTNLEYVTHSQNILKSFQNGRTSCWKGKTITPPGLATRLKMANAKHKPVNLLDNETGFERTFDSIAELVKHLGWYRKKFNRTINFKNGIYENYVVSFAKISTKHP